MNQPSSRQIEPIGRFDAMLALPTSKSITNRALLLAALSEAPGTVVTPLKSDDCLAFVQALNDMGAVLRWKGDDVVVVQPLQPGQSAKVNCHDAGTAARFLPPAAVALEASVYFDASPQMRGRPMADLFGALRKLGALTDPANRDYLPQLVTASGGMKGGEIHLNGQVSSQFLSGLLMAAPLAKTPLTIHCSDLISRPYIDLTIAMMGDFGTQVERSGYSEFRVTQLGPYHRTKPYEVEADASTAGYFFALAAVTGSKILVTNLRKSSLQGDLKLLDALEKMGAQVVDSTRGISVQGPPKSKKLQGITIDMSDISDVMMTLACIAPFAESPVRITNVGQARVKECDRIDAVADGLTRLGIWTEEGKDWLTIYPGTPKSAVIDPRRDHRIAMSFAVLGMAMDNPGMTIENWQCVSKTCPTFFDICADIGNGNLDKGTVVTL